MKRRDLVVLGGSAAAVRPLAAHAQTARRPLRVGTANAQPRSAPQWAAFLRRMAELSYREGQDFFYDHLQTPDPQAWVETYRKVMESNPDIVVAAGPEPSLKAAIETAGKRPVVMVAVDYDPVAKGYVKSLSRPSGQVTGVCFQSVELAGKRLEMLREAFPDVSTMIVFWDRASIDHWSALQEIAPRVGLQLIGLEFKARPYDYEAALAGRLPPGRSFFYAGASPFFFLDRAALQELALRHRLLSIGDFREQAVAGALMSYGPSLPGMFALAATYVDRVARGAVPADTPIEQPTRFELVLNLATARAIGVTFPPTLRARAEEEIE